MKNLKTKKFLVKARRFLCVFLFALNLLGTMTAYAAPQSGAPEVITNLNSLVDMVLSFFQVIGSFVLGYGLFQFGKAFASHDPAARPQGLETAAGGLICLAIPSLIKIFV